MLKKSPFFGELSARYKFFLNPYSDIRFSRCPQCEGKTSQKKVPLMIHVDPHYPINLNYTCRYCPRCDVLIAHKDEIEGHLHGLFSERAPEVIDNDYMVMGTTERSYWKEGFTKPHLPPETLANLHGFKEYLNFKRIGGWLPDEKEEELPAKHSEDTFFVDNIDEAMKLIEKMKKHLPIVVRPSSALVKSLRRQGINVDRYKPLEMHSVLYMGNEAGIACDITPKGREKNAVICSLTQLDVLGTDALAEEMRAYQKERVKNLARFPGNEKPMSFTITPRRKK
ncbi:MAG: hypothetical protein ABI621_02915 [Chloroflexota bacterium]